MWANLPYLKCESTTEEDTINFRCTQCGKCCKRSDLILLGPDIYRIATKLQMTMEEVIRKYCEVYIGSDSKLPVVNIRSRIYDGKCPYSKNDRCTLHPDHKPSTCLIYPLGRMYDSRTSEYVYFKQDISCEGVGKGKVTVGEWLKEHNIDKLQNMYMLWNQYLLEITMYVMTIKEAELLRKVQNAIFNGLYLQYDMSISYKEGLQKNISILRGILPGFETRKN